MKYKFSSLIVNGHEFCVSPVFLDQSQAGPDLAGGRPGAQSNYGSISVTTVFP